MLRFENKFKVGQKIKAYDFKSMTGRPDRFIIGKIEEITDKVGYKAYVTRVTFDVDDHRVGQLSYIPMGVSMMEYNERIQLIKE